MRRFLATSVVLLLSGIPAFSQTSSSSQTGNANLGPAVIRAIAAFSSVPVASVHITGTAHAIAGSTNERGTFTLDLDRNGKSTFALTAGALSRNDQTGNFNEDPACIWAGADSVTHQTANHNCWLPVNWMLPLLALQNPTVTLKQSVSASTQADGSHVSEITIQRDVASRAAGKWIARFSKVNIDLDPSTFVPVSMTFAQHPDNNSFSDIAIEIRYSDYRQVNRANLPFRIQKYVNHALALDLEVSDATVQ